MVHDDVSGIVYPKQDLIGASDDLMNHYNEISKQCREDNYMKSRIELFEMLMEAEEDAAKGRVSSIQDTFNDLRTRLCDIKW